jgi:hypothetical protein
MLGDRSTAPGILGMALALSIAGSSGCLGPDAFKFRGTSAAGFMKTIEESKDPNARFLAYDKLSSSRTYQDDAQKTRAAELLTLKLKNGHEPIATRAVICRTLGMLEKPIARDAIRASLNDEDPLVRAEAARALGRVGRPEDATTLAQIMALDASIECKVAAIESLGTLKSQDQRILEMLVRDLENDQPVIRVCCLKALKAITGKDLGVDAMAWKKFVEASSPKSAETSPDKSPGITATPGLPALPRELPPEIP